MRRKTPRPRLSRYAIAAVLTGALLGTSTLAVAHSSSRSTHTGVVQTTNGPIRGVRENGISVFLGIPYAAPPVGSLRWRPPQSPQRWRHTLDTNAFAKTCAQSNTLGVFAAASTDEDCLYLNVFAPDQDSGHGVPHGWGKNAFGHNHGGGHGRKNGLPVMVWIHGGGHFDGESNDYDGRKLATDGDVVVVSINYRLNVFGFLSHPALDSERHTFGNYGFMDQQFALKWVQRNIAKFGGDPRNVTIFGESAGGGSVFAAMASPTAKGLFQKAIAESGSYVMITNGLTCPTRRPMARSSPTPSAAPISRPLACAHCRQPRSLPARRNSPEPRPG